MQNTEKLPLIGEQLLLWDYLWHGARTIFRDVFTGIGPEVTEQVEFGAFRKIGDKTTPRKGSI